MDKLTIVRIRKKLEELKNDGSILNTAMYAILVGDFQIDKLLDLAEEQAACPNDS